MNWFIDIICKLDLKKQVATNNIYNDVEEAPAGALAEESMDGEMKEFLCKSILGSTELLYLEEND